MKKPLLFIMITLLLSTLSVSFAYVPNGWVLTYPTSCWFYISEDTNSSPYLNDLIYYTKQWNSLPELGLYQTYSPSDHNIAMYVVSYDTGNYALAQHYSDDYHTATFYPSWKNLSLTNRREVIVHEIGHCLAWLIHKAPTIPTPSCDNLTSMESRTPYLMIRLVFPVSIRRTQ